MLGAILAPLPIFHPDTPIVAAGPSWYDYDWRARKVIYVANGSGAGANYPLGAIIVSNTTGADSGNTIYLDGPCGSANFGDIRFADNDGTTLLSYYMPEYNSTSAVFYVKVTDNLSANQSIYLYYNAVGKTTLSSPASVVLFYDDFTGASFNSTKWIVNATGAVYCALTSSGLNVTGGTSSSTAYWIYNRGGSYHTGNQIQLNSTTFATPTNCSIVWKVTTADTAAAQKGGSGIAFTDASYSVYTYVPHVDDSGTVLQLMDHSSYYDFIESTTSSYNSIVSSPISSRFEITKIGTTITAYDRTNVTTLMTATSANTVRIAIAIGVYGGYAFFAYSRFSYMFVRNYVSPEPYISSTLDAENVPYKSMGYEPMIGLPNLIDITPATTGSYVSVNISSYLPTGATGAIIDVQNSGASIYRFDVRPYGETGDEDYNYGYGSLRTLNHVYAYVKVSSRCVDIVIENTAIRTYLVGSFSYEAGFLTTRQTITVASGNTWTPVNATLKGCPANATGAIVKFTNTNTGQRVALTRANDSSDQLFDSPLYGRAAFVDTYGYLWTIVPLTDGYFQQYVNDTSVYSYLLGYVNPYDEFFKFNNNVTKLTLNATSTWENVYLPDLKPSFVVLDVHMNGTAAYAQPRPYNTTISLMQTKIYQYNHVIMAVGCYNWTFQMYRSSSDVVVYLIGYGYDTVAASIRYLLEERVNANYSVDTNYMAWMFGKNQTSIESYIDSYATSTNWASALKWSAIMNKYGVERATAINNSLTYATMTAGGLANDSRATISMWTVHYGKSSLLGYYWAVKFNNNLTKWNVTKAYQSFNGSVWNALDYAAGPPLAVSTSGVYNSGYGRFYDEFSSVIQDYLLFNWLNVSGAFADAQKLWNTTVARLWNSTSGIFSYTVIYPAAECEAGFFLVDTSLLRYYNATLANWALVENDMGKRFLSNNWNSYQWMDGDTQTSAYVVIHSYNPFGALNNTQRRMANTLAAWESILAISDILNSTYRNNMITMVKGTTSLQPAWKLLYSDNAALWNGTAQKFQGFSGSYEANDDATLQAMHLQFFLGAIPYNSTIALPLEDYDYEYIYGGIDHDLFGMDFGTNTIKIAVYKGTMGFQYGAQEVNYTFPSSGVYNITFGTNWNSISNATKLSGLPSATRIFLGQTTTELAQGWNTVTPQSIDVSHTLGQVATSLNVDSVNWTTVVLKYANGSSWPFVNGYTVNTAVTISGIDNTLYIYCNVAGTWTHKYG